MERLRHEIYGLLEEEAIEWWGWQDVLDIMGYWGGGDMNGQDLFYYVS